MLIRQCREHHVSATKRVAMLNRAVTTNRRVILIAVVLLANTQGLPAQEKSAATLPALPESVESYRLKKKQLEAADAALWFDSSIRLSAREQLVNNQLIALRLDLIKKYKQEKHFPPSEPFYAVKKDLQETALFRFLRGMPKGGVLHIHTSSTAPAEWVVTKGIREPNCYICWPNDQGKAIKGQIGFFSPDKVPAGYQTAQHLLRNDRRLPEKLQKLITINADDAELTNGQIWTKFDRIFQRMGGLVSYQPIFEKYYRAAFQTLLNDRVFYVELRTGFGELYDLAGNTYDYKKKVALLWKIRNQMRKMNPHFDLKIICSGYRGGSIKNVGRQLKQAADLREIWSDRNFVIGFDLVGEEDAGRTTEYFLPDWIKLQRYLKKRKATLPLYFHDGESDWPSDENLYDAYLMGSRRIGHGFNLFRFPTLERRMKQSGVALEVCPISNQMLRYIKDLRIHPANGYLRRGMPCVLGNDDPGILGNDGLTFDFWEATMSWELDLASLKQLAWNSLQYSGMTAAEKKAAVSHWEEEWNQWVADCCEKLN